jgi:hypothetical protein
MTSVARTHRSRPPATVSPFQIESFGDVEAHWLVRHSMDSPRAGIDAGTPVALKTFRVSPLIVLTIGHSTRPIEQFIRLLKMHRVRRVIDVRAIPMSRHNPQFNGDRLSRALHRSRIHYSHLSGLGGRRRARKDSPNIGWRNASFRGYADYMQTARFRRSLNRSIELATQERVVLMCAEAVPWRCHRSLIADALLVRGIAVREITSGVRTRPHSLTPWALVRGTQITYPGRTRVARIHQSTA